MNNTMRRDDFETHTIRSTNNKEKNELSSLVESLCAADDRPTIRRNRHGQPLPSRDVVINTIDDLRSVLFPGYFGISDVSTDSIHFYVGSTLDRVKRILEEQVKWGLCFVCSEERKWKAHKGY